MVYTFMHLWVTVAHLQALFILQALLSTSPHTNKMDDPWQKAYDFAVEVARKAGAVRKSQL